MKSYFRELIAGGVAAICVIGGGIAYYAYPDTVIVDNVVKSSISSSIVEVGQIEADKAITVYAPASGKITNVCHKVNDVVAKNEVLAKYDLNSFVTDAQIASVNTNYYEDGYNAAVTDNNANIEKLKSIGKSVEELKTQYADLEKNRETITVTQHERNTEVKSATQELEESIRKMQDKLDNVASTGESANNDYQEMKKKVDEAQADVNDMKNKIIAVKDEIDAYQEEIDNCEKDSEDYNRLFNLIQDDSEELETLNSDIESKKETVDGLQEQLEEIEGIKTDAENKAAEIKSDIDQNIDALSELPVEELTPEDFAVYTEITNQLSLLEKEWERSLDEKTRAQDKIVNESHLKQLEDSIELAKIEMNKANIQLDAGKKGVESSVDGTVIERLIDDGALVEEGTPLFVVQPSTGYKVSVMVSRFDIDGVVLGQPAQINMGKKTYEGSVAAISPIATEDENGKPRVKVDIEINDKAAKPTIGLEADVTIVAKGNKDALCVPENAVYTDDQGDCVYVYDNNKVKRKSVEKGKSGNGYTEIKCGLEEGDTVIVSDVSENDIGKKVKAKKSSHK
ncbi:HlyD family efflux transporter periplasmic adaptor subunit [Butyrivibrio sp. AE3004]|uniref:HlyD family efflux transporter periplasmic adaptor subunit n=1 Tax=Butyrivibrio sp. AE3004 TaxID=1506994 RepID=UPI0004948593|nr:HlyD family efflux transporter periplasmic adaptor subunit [Butyrivibrio sp. AE3004]